MIIKKVKKNNKNEYHGGMWKVAYADFVTAMMCFFLLLWLLSVVPQDNLKGVAKYFAPVAGSGKDVGFGFDGGIDPNVEVGSYALESTTGALIYGSPTKGSTANQARLSNLLSDNDRENFTTIMNNLQQSTLLKEFAENIAMDVTKDGLRIQIMDSDNRPMFYPNTVELQPYMIKILNTLAKMIKNQPNYLAISGYTTSFNKDKIDLWDLSFNRANKVRQFFDGLINKDKILKIVGNADKDPINIQDLSDVKNIRISITLLNNNSLSESQKSLPDINKK